MNTVKQTTPEPPKSDNIQELELPKVKLYPTPPPPSKK